MDTFITRLESLGKNLEGDLKHDKITTTIYSTDASVYKEEPTAVIWPKGVSDIKKILFFARNEKSNLTFRAGGTSLAGQVVSSGIIVDISRYMNKILEINKEEKWARVEPGVVLDELNLAEGAITEDVSKETDKVTNQPTKRSRKFTIATLSEEDFKTLQELIK